VPQLPPTPLQPLTPEYSAAQDIQNLDNFFSDSLNALKFAGLIENDTSLARTEVEKQVRVPDSNEIFQANEIPGCCTKTDLIRSSWPFICDRRSNYR
jgi:hypothetical protein